MQIVIVIESEATFIILQITKLISQDFSDCGLRNDKSTKNSPRENCVNRA
jgi:hypothetical protein